MPLGPHSVFSSQLPKRRTSFSSNDPAVCRFVHIGVEVSKTRKPIQRTAPVERLPPSRDWHSQSLEISIWIRFPTSDHPRLAWLTYGRRPHPKPARASIFPACYASSSRALRSKILTSAGPPLTFRPFRFRLRASAISGHASPGNGSRTRDQMETSNDCYRLCPQRR